MKGIFTIFLCAGSLTYLSCNKVSDEAVSDHELSIIQLISTDSIERPMYFEHEYVFRAVVCDPNNPNMIYYCRENQPWQNEILEYNMSAKTERLVYSYPNRRVGSLDLNRFGQLLISAWDAGSVGEIVCVNIKTSQVEFTLTSEYLFPIIGGVWLNDSSFTFTKFTAGPGKTLTCNRKGEVISSSASYDGLVILSPEINQSVYYCKTNDSIQTYGTLNLKTSVYQTFFKFFYKSYPVSFVRDKVHTGFWTIQPYTAHLFHFNENTSRLTEHPLFKSNIILNYLAPYPVGNDYLISVSVYSREDGQDVTSEYFALSNLKDNSIKIIKEIHH